MASSYQYEHFNITCPKPFVYHVEVNRPTKMNAWIEPMWLGLGKMFNQLSHDPEVRAIVLSGAGTKAFTAGLDVHAASTGGSLFGGGNDDPARKATGIRRHLLEFQDCLTAVEKCEKRMLSPDDCQQW
jgi:Delta3,5-Delta2,4-dienoyl-CoA isomerase